VNIESLLSKATNWKIKSLSILVIFYELL